MLGQYKMLGAILAFAAYSVGAFWFGAEWSDKGWSERVAKAESEQKSLVLNIEREQKYAEHKLLEEVDSILDAEDVKTEVINSEKIAYRASPGAGSCKFPDAGVQILNSAAGLPRVPEASGDAEAKPKAVSDIEVVSVVSENMRLCVEERIKYKGLWDWAESVYNVRLTK